MTTLTGTAGNDTLNGTIADDVMDGLAGADKMVGGAGSDTYYVENAGDVVVEAANGGAFDTVSTSVTLTSLAANVELVRLTGAGAINAVGNNLNNWLDGNLA